MPRSVHLWVALTAALLTGIEGRAQFKPAPPSYQQQQPAYSPAAQITPPNGQESLEDPEAPADQQHGVARLSVVLGEVGIRRGDTSEVVAAIPNAPLQKGDSVQTSPTGAAEVQLDGANVIRIAENSEIGFSDLQFRRAQIQLTAGSALYRVFQPSDMDVEIDTPSVAVRPLGVSAIRITLLDGGVARIAVYAGSAEMLGPQGSQPLQAGSTVLARMGPSGPEFQQTASSPQDQFDGWSSSRDQELLNSPSVPLVGPEVSGSEDLDRNGNWVPSQYGQVWEPRDVGAEWAPYSNGQWAWENYYGWTWVDYSPWGWAPYHYGRWFRNGSYGWCWWPGQRGIGHVWRPALVGFFGSGGGLGWVALAPHESFQAWWGRRSWIGGNRYGNAGVHFQNAGFRGAALFAQGGNFSGPHQRFGWATADQLRTATRFDGRLPVTPNQSSYRFSNQAFVPNRGGRVSTMTRQQPGFSVSPRSSSSPSVSGGLANGWQRFGDPGAQRNAERSSFTATSRGESGWHQFGRPPSQPQAQQQANRSFATRNSYQAAAPRSAPAQGAAGSNWRSFSSRPSGQTWSGQGGGSGGGAARYAAPAQSYRQQAAPSTPHYTPPARESFHSSGGGGNQVRQPAAHSAPSGGGGGGNHGGGGGRPSGGGGGGGHSRR